MPEKRAKIICINCDGDVESEKKGHVLEPYGGMGARVVRPGV